MIMHQHEISPLCRDKEEASFEESVEENEARPAGEVMMSLVSYG